MALRMAFSFVSKASNARVLADLTTLTDSSESANDEARIIQLGLETVVADINPGDLLGRCRPVAMRDGDRPGQDIFMSV